MKKTFLGILCIVLAIVLAGCNTPAVKITNSYKFGYIPSNLTENGLLESFSYTVKNTESESTIQPPFILNGEGVYNVKIYKENDEQLYRVVTDFTFEGKYLYTSSNTESELFTTNITSEALSYIGAESFGAKSSKKTFTTSIPVVNEGVYSLKKAYYTTEIDYTKTDSGYHITSKVADTETSEENVSKMARESNSNIAFDTGDRFVENEFMFFAIRLQNGLDSSFSDSFKVMDALYGVMQTMKFSTGEKTEVKKFADPQDPSKEKEFDCLVVSAVLTGNNTGSPTLMYFTQDYAVKYQKDSSGQSLAYPNIALMLEFSQGNLIYTLNSYANHALKVD